MPRVVKGERPGLVFNVSCGIRGQFLLASYLLLDLKEGTRGSTMRLLDTRTVSETGLTDAIDLNPIGLRKAYG